MRRCSLSHFFKVAVGAFVASTALVFGQQYDENCCYQDCCQQEPGLLDGIEVGAEYLYWQPFFDDLEFGFASSGSPVSGSSSGSSSEFAGGRFHNLNHDWVSGFRVFAGLKKDMCCGLNLWADYTRLEDSRKRRLHPPAGGFLSSTLFHPVLSEIFSGFDVTELSGHHRFEYDSYDVLFSHDFCLTECHRIVPYFGLTGMDLNRRTHSRIALENPSTGFTAEGNFHQKNDFWGIGLKVGSEYRYQIFDSLSLYGNGNLAILAGDVTAHNRQGFVETSPDGTVIVTDEFSFRTRDDWRLVPGFQVGVGFCYDTTICDWGITATVGYEFIQWFNLPRTRRFVSTSSSSFAVSTSEKGEHFGFQGLNVGLALRF